MFRAHVSVVNNQLGLINNTVQRYLSSSAAYVTTTEADTLQNELQTAKPFKAIPGPGKLKLVSSFFPGGSLHKKNMNEINATLREQYGDIFLFPGLYGKRDVLFTFNPNDIRKVFRTEGPWPMRRGLDVIEYYRKTRRPEIFSKAAGLVAEQGERWQQFRTAVNPVMMNPKTFKLYAPKINHVANQFITRIKTIRDSSTLEVPDTFEEELNYLTMESIGVIALDTNLGLIDRTASNAELKAFIENIRNFFDLLFELEIKPSMWKYVATPSFNKFIKVMDMITDMSRGYVEEAKKRMDIEEAKGITKPEMEKSVLERLIKINPNVAIVMAMDTMLAGVDTSSSALVSCLLCLCKHPEKQKKLREEMLRILPEKSSPLTTEKMMNMPYLRACIKEALRYFPVTTANFRTTYQEIVLSGYRVPADVDIAMPTMAIMRDEKYYVRANEYLPERWLRGPEACDANGTPLNNNTPFVFLPFGFGPRMCIGKRIVDLEIEVLIARLIRNFEIEFNYGVEDAFKTHVINIPGKPMKFKFIDLKK